MISTLCLLATATSLSHAATNGLLRIAASTTTNTRTTRSFVKRSVSAWDSATSFRELFGNAGDSLSMSMSMNIGSHGSSGSMSGSGSDGNANSGNGSGTGSGSASSPGTGLPTNSTVPPFPGFPSDIPSPSPSLANATASDSPVQTPTVDPLITGTAGPTSTFDLPQTDNGGDIIPSAKEKGIGSKQKNAMVAVLVVAAAAVVVAFAARKIGKHKAGVKKLDAGDGSTVESPVAFVSAAKVDSMDSVEI